MLPNCGNKAFHKLYSWRSWKLCSIWRGNKQTWECFYLFKWSKKVLFYSCALYTDISTILHNIIGRLPAILLKKKKYFSILSTSGNFHVMNQMIWERGLVQFPFVSPPYQTFSPSLFLSRPSLCSPSRSKIWQNLFFCNFFLEKTFFLYPTKTPWVSHKFVTSKR